MPISIGCGQITWPRGTDDTTLLSEIAAAGYAGAPISRQTDETPAALLMRYAAHGLRPAPGYYSADFWDPAQRATILAQAEDQARFAAACGVDALYVAANGFGYQTRSGQPRHALAGHVGADDGLNAAEMQQFAETLNAFAAITLAAGVRSCFHNHVGTPIETGAEIDALLALTDPALLFLGPDTGHLAWGGSDPLAFCRAHASRIMTIHLKDIDAAVAARGRAEGWGYGQTQDQAVWVELGQGAVDFPAIFTVLRDADFAGWAIVETDVTQLPNALESARVSRAYLQQLGH